MQEEKIRGSSERCIRCSLSGQRWYSFPVDDVTVDLMEDHNDLSVKTGSTKHMSIRLINSQCPRIGLNDRKCMNVYSRMHNRQGFILE